MQAEFTLTYRTLWFQDDYIHVEASCAQFVEAPLNETVVRGIHALFENNDGTVDDTVLFSPFLFDAVVQSGVNPFENILIVIAKILAYNDLSPMVAQNFRVDPRESVSWMEVFLPDYEPCRWSDEC